MHRFFLPPEACHGSVLSLSGREAHHALHVLRLGAGDNLTVLDGRGQVIDCEITTTRQRELELRVLQRRTSPDRDFELLLAQAVPKGKLFEEVIEKATELGVSRVVPLITERTIARGDKQDLLRKSDKWRQVAVEALKQCGTPWLPTIEPPMSITDFLHIQQAIPLPLVASLATGALHPRLYFERFLAKQGTLPGSVSVAIGPEGDFTPNELHALQEAGAEPITLGPLVLRTDTAAAYCLSILSYELRNPNRNRPGITS